MRARVAYGGAVHEARPATGTGRVRLADGRELAEEEPLRGRQLGVPVQERLGDLRREGRCGRGGVRGVEGVGLPHAPGHVLAEVAQVVDQILINGSLGVDGNQLLHLSSSQEGDARQSSSHG